MNIQQTALLIYVPQCTAVAVRARCLLAVQLSLSLVLLSRASQGYSGCVAAALQINRSQAPSDRSAAQRSAAQRVTLSSEAMSIVRVRLACPSQDRFQPVLKVWVDGHGRRPGTYYQGWTPSSHFLGQCIHCGQQILRKIGIVATRCQILRLKCTKFGFRWGSATDPTRGCQRPQLYLRSLLVRGGRRGGKRKGE